MGKDIQFVIGENIPDLANKVTNFIERQPDPLRWSCINAAETKNGYWVMWLEHVI